jgi:hypothetical protein
VHIRKVSIQNIRCFGSGDAGVDLDLTRPDGSLAGWTVLAGRNGTGKTTLLQAMALAVAGPRRKLQEGFADWIHGPEAAGGAELILSLGAQDRFSGGGRRPTRELTVGLHWRKIPGSGPEPSMDETGTERRSDAHRARGPWTENPEGWFIAGYGPYRRLGQGDGKRRTAPLMVDRLICLFDEDATLNEAIEWLKQDVLARRLDLVERRKKANGKDELDAIDVEVQRLFWLEHNVLRLLDDELLPDGAEVYDFNTDGLAISQGGHISLLRNFSDGYRAVVGLVFDIVRQMYRAFGEFEVEEFEAHGRKHVRVPYEGVVLIDEIDAHLHVSWQKRIGFWLKRHFPNVQFIVTTHSPFICQAADPNGLIRLRSPGDPRPTRHVPEDVYYAVVNGGADDAVMSELFGLESPHSEEADQLRDEVARLEALLLEGKARKADKSRLEALSARLPRTPSADVGRALRALTARIDTKIEAQASVKKTVKKR